MSRKRRLVVIPPQHLGHEIHVGRIIVCDMLNRGYLSPELGDSIITGLSDRKFLYQGLFGAEKVHDFSELPNITIPIQPPRTIAEYIDIQSSDFLSLPQFCDFDIINLANYSAPPTNGQLPANDEMGGIGYEIPETFIDENFKLISQNFNFLSQDALLEYLPPQTDFFILIHHRYGASLDNLLMLFSKFPSEVLKIIFTFNVRGVSSSLKGISNLSFTDNLRIYASLLRDSRCKLLVSEWSGGGQLSQYTLGPQGVVWYYYETYSDVYDFKNFEITHKTRLKNSMSGSYFDFWDFKCTSGCSIQYFPNFANLLNWSP